MSGATEARPGPAAAGVSSRGGAQGPAPARRVDAGELIQRYGLVVIWAGLIVVFGILRPDTFLTGDNFANIFGSQAVIAVLTLAILVPATSGDYDLSVAGILSLSAMTTAILNVNHGWPIGLAVLFALALGAAVGMVNGGIVTYFGIDPFIVTLGTGTFLGGVVLWISDSNTITGVSSSLVDATIGTRFLGIPLTFYYALLLCAGLWYLLNYTALGRRLLIVGRNRSVARLSGYRVKRIRFGAFVASGTISACAGVLYVGTSGSADPTSGAQLLLPAFAGAFLGATTIVPGRFNAWGSLIAVYFLVTGITGLQLLGVATFVQDLFYGGALVIAVVLSQVARRKRLAESGG